MYVDDISTRAQRQCQGVNTRSDNILLVCKIVIFLFQAMHPNHSTSSWALLTRLLTVVSILNTHTRQYPYIARRPTFVDHLIRAKLPVLLWMKATESTHIK